jgi:hypothetical protein
MSAPVSDKELLYELARVYAQVVLQKLLAEAEVEMNAPRTLAGVLGREDNTGKSSADAIIPL